MNKKYLKLIIIPLIILILAVVAVYFVTSKNTGDDLSVNKKVDLSKKDIMSEQDKNSLGLYHLGIYEVLARDKSGKPTSYQLVSLNEEKPISTELMTDTEKVKLQIDPKYKIQVIQRDASGAVSAYKVLKSDTDIVKQY